MFWDYVLYNCADAVFTVLAVKCAVTEVGEQLEKQFIKCAVMVVGEQL